MNATTDIEGHREAGPAGRGDPAGSPRRSTPRHERGGNSLWLWVAAAFLFVGLLWTTLFLATGAADTRTVPLATKGGRP